MPTYESHVTTSPVFAAPAKITYPFANQGDTATKMVHQPLLQLADRYAPPTLGTAFVGATDANFSGSPVTIGSAYCIGDTEPQPADAGLVSFTRMWANIPASRTVPTGTTLYQFVGLTVGSAGTVKTITAMSLNAATLVLTSAAHGLSVGNFISVSLQFSLGGAYTLSTIFTSPITATTTNTVTVSYGALSTSTLISGNMRQTDPYRNTFQAKTSTFTQFEYALPGVTSGITTLIDFQPASPFSPILASNGQSIADYAELGNRLSTLTSPTDTEYRAMIVASSLLTAESDISVWEGLILERKTLLVRAI